MSCCPNIQRRNFQRKNISMLFLNRIFEHNLKNRSSNNWKEVLEKKLKTKLMRCTKFVIIIVKGARSPWGTALMHARTHTQNVNTFCDRDGGEFEPIKA